MDQAEREQKRLSELHHECVRSRMYVQMPGRPGKDIWLADSCSKRVQEGCAFQWRFLRDLGEGQCKVGLRLVHGGRRKTKKIHLQIVGRMWK